MDILLYISQAILLAFYRLCKEDYLYRAAGLAYTTLLSLVPLLSVILYLGLFLPQSNVLIQLFNHFLITNLIPSSILPVEKYIKLFISHGSQLPSYSFIFLLITSTTLILSIMSTFKLIYAEEKNTLNGWLIYFIKGFFLPFLFIFCLLINFYLTSTTWFITLNKLSILKTGLNLTLSFFLNGLFFSIIYLTLLKRPVCWRHKIMGGYITAFIFEIIRQSFGFFIKWISNYDIIYGTFAIIPLFIIWLYIVWVTIILGALFIFELHQSKILNIG